ncbi:MAG: SIS domain-containing protein [Candidatus Thorarchaeota archaeon]
MISTDSNQLSSFYSAYHRLLKAGKKAVNFINQAPPPLMEFCEYLSRAREKQNLVHIVGMGRSGKVGMLLGEILKNIGFRISYLGKSLAKPVRKDDVVIGVTGSGWTPFTCKSLDDSIQRGAKILVMTRDPRSKAARLADTIIEIPYPVIAGFEEESSSNHAPLTPMGTMFEMNSLLVGMGIFSGLNDDSTIKGFNDGVNRVLSASEATLAYINDNEEVLSKFIRLIERYSNKPEKKVYIYGSGLDAIIGSMTSIRLIHCSVNIKSNYDWRFRDSDDMLIAISGSGNSTSTLERVGSARSAEMNVVGLTSFPESRLAQNSDIFIKLEGRTESRAVELRQISDLRILLPSFEYVTAIFMDSCVAQLAHDLRISESEMRREHANIQ